jgi:hypothetical protein
MIQSEIFQRLGPGRSLPVTANTFSAIHLAILAHGLQILADAMAKAAGELTTHW